jgi:hypothetical protein
LFIFINLTTTKQIPLIGIFTSNNDNNRSSSLVIDYALHYLKTTQNLTTELSIEHSEQDIPCDMAIGTKMIFDMIDRKPRPLAIFSGSCQLVASAIAETAGIYDMTIVRDWICLYNISICCFFFLFEIDYLFGNKFTIYSSREISIINSNCTW